MHKQKCLAVVCLDFFMEKRYLIDSCEYFYHRLKELGTWLPTMEKGDKETMKMVRAKDLTYEYVRVLETEQGTQEEKVAALKQINIEINKGDFVAVLGHNGSGKSTFAKHINALLQPTGGTLWVDDMDTKEDELVWEWYFKIQIISWWPR